jgi:hypothetical protein
MQGHWIQLCGHRTWNRVGGVKSGTKVKSDSGQVKAINQTNFIFFTRQKSTKISGRVMISLSETTLQKMTDLTLEPVLLISCQHPQLSR